MSTTVHSRWVGCQNWVKLGPRSYWMTPKSSSTEEWRSNTSFLWQSTLRNTTRPRRPFRHIFLGKSYSFSCPFTSVLQMMFWEVFSSETQSQLNIVKVEKFWKGILDSIPSPSLSVTIQIMGGKVCKELLGIVNKKFVDITQQCFALLLQVNFLANDLNFHWRLSS